MYNGKREASRARREASGSPTTQSFRRTPPAPLGGRVRGADVAVRPGGRFRENEVDDVVGVRRGQPRALRRGDHVVGRRDQAGERLRGSEPLATERYYQLWGGGGRHI